MATQASPFCSSSPGAPVSMVYQTENDRADIVQVQVQPNQRTANTNDHIERVNVQEPHRDHKPPYHESIIEPGPAPSKITPLHQLGEDPATIACPYCRYRAQTRISKEDTNMTTICGVVLCLFCICAACLPCLCGWFQDVHHYCTHCSKIVATRRQDGSIQVYTPEPDSTYYPDAPEQPAPAHQRG